jgi:hypothetical protein
MSEGPRSPTRSEINTFKVLSNLDFTDLRKPEPQFSEHREMPEESEARPLTPKALTPVPSLPMTPESSSPPSPVQRPLTPPKPAAAEDPVYTEAKKMSAVDVTLEKEALLYELEIMEKQGSIKLHRQLTIADDLDTIQYQYDRANMIISTQQTVEWAKTGIRMGSGLVETFAKKFGIHMIDGFSNNLCKDMSKFNKPLTKMYRKYWRRGSSSPETELAMIVFGSLAMTVLANRSSSREAPRPAAASAEPEKRADPEPQPEIIKPVAEKTFKVPEWARNALAADPPVHFAQQKVPEKVPEPPQAASATEAYTEPIVASRPPVIAAPVAVQGETKKLTLTSPRSSRRKKEVQEELNLDD